MRKFDGAATVADIDGIGHRITLRTATGEAVYHDLSEAEVDAFRAALETPDVVAPDEPEPKPRAKPKAKKS